ncbi:MAG: ABC transporter permease [Bryobacteraceae bacterium]
MLSNFSQALRRFRAAPGFTGIALATLALGIGGTTAMFSLVNAILLKPLAYHEPERLYTILLHIPKLAQRLPALPVNAWHFNVWRKDAKSLESVSALRGFAATLTGDGEPERLDGVRMSANLFRTLGVRPRIGRDFRDEEDAEGKDRVVILSDGLWRRRFSGDPGVIGRKILLDNQPFEVVGVMPPGFRFLPGMKAGDLSISPRRAEFWRPLAFSKEELAMAFGRMNYAIIGRLRPGVTQAQVLTELSAMENEIAKNFSQPIEMRPLVQPLHDMTVRDVRRGLLLLLGATGFVLLIGCINLANLMLARANAMRRELAIRSALGARLGHLMGQLLAESMLLALVGGAIGMLAAQWLIDLAVAHAPIGLPRLDDVRMDWQVLLFASGVSIACGALFGILPAWRAAAADPQEALQSAGRGSTDGPRGGRLRQLLVVAEVALSVMLLLGAGLLLRSFSHILQVDRGFEERNVISAGVSLPFNKYRERSQRLVFYREVAERIRAISGVNSVGWISDLPVTSEDNMSPVSAGDRPAPPITEQPIVNYRTVDSEYFRTLGIPLREGRIFSEAADGDRRAVVITENLAERLWPGQSPLERELREVPEFYKPPYARVVGVVGAVHVASLTQEPGMIAYFPLWQRTPTSMSLAVKTAMDPIPLAGEIRRAIWSVDSQIPVPEIRTMESVIAESVAPRRFQMLLLAAFAFVALLLASLGIYGVVSYAVGRRTNEIGIRIALGAESGQVRGMVVRQGLLPVGAGLVLGLAGSFASAGVIRTLLYGVGALDPVTYAAVPLLLLIVALAACLLPARRATRIDPVTALRYE